MKTTYLNPFNQAALNIIKNYGNITRISQTTEHINQIIKNTYNQEPKKVDTIKEICYDKIRYYYHDQAHTKTSSYTYLFSQALEEEDIISTHALLQAVAITYGSNSYEADTIVNSMESIIKCKLEKTDDKLIDETLTEYIDIHNTTLNDVIELINTDNIRLNELLVSNDRIIITYEDFLGEYGEYLEHRRPESMYQALCIRMKKHLITGLITQKIRNYMKTIEDKLKQVEPATVIREIGEKIRHIQQTEREEIIQHKYGNKNNFTTFDDDQPTSYITEAFPPCVKKALNGIKSGGRNYCISLFLTPFLSYARLYPGVYARHIKQPRIVDMDPTLNITHDEIIPLIHQAAQNCQPPLFQDQPQEKQNINSKLGFGEAEIKYDNAGKTPWYTPTNCKNIQQQQPGLCTPCKDCQRIGNPLSYYNRKRKLLTRSGKNAAKTSH